MLPTPYTRFPPATTCAHPLVSSTDAVAALVHDIALAASILSDWRNGCIATTGAAFATTNAGFDRTSDAFASPGAAFASPGAAFASTGAAFDTTCATFQRTNAAFNNTRAAPATTIAASHDCTQQHHTYRPPLTGLRRTRPPPPLRPPPSNPTIIHRKITSTTYRRRMFLTAPLARLFGFDSHAVQTCRLLGRRLPATLIDANTERRYAVLYDPRPGKTITGELSGEWSRFARNVRIGDVIEFSVWNQGRDAGQYGACARVLWAAG